MTIPHEKLIHGWRIVDYGYFIKWLTLAQVTHSQHRVGVLWPIQEDCKSMVSTVLLKCNVCSKVVKGSSEKPKSNKRLRHCLGWAILRSGGTFSQTQELFSMLNMPFLSHFSFNKDEVAMDNVLETALEDSLNRAIEQEKQAVLKELKEQGRVLQTDEIIGSSAALDGLWGQRSNGHRYNSASGCAAIIGTRSKKVCYVECKNKRCIACITRTS